MWGNNVTKMIIDSLHVFTYFTRIISGCNYKIKRVHKNNISFQGGDSKTLMVVQVSPALKNVGETLCSLNFAQRVRMVELGQATKKIDNEQMVCNTSEVFLGRVLCNAFTQ
jgi:hypothetical protein